MESLDTFLFIWEFVKKKKISEFQHPIKYQKYFRQYSKKHFRKYRIKHVRKHLIKYRRKYFRKIKCEHLRKIECEQSREYGNKLISWILPEFPSIVSEAFNGHLFVCFMYVQFHCQKFSCALYTYHCPQHNKKTFNSKFLPFVPSSECFLWHLKKNW